MHNFRTLGQFIIEKQADFPYAKGELSRLLRDIGIAAKIVNREVNKAGLMDILGNAGNTNIQGESQQKLDVYANEQFIAALRSGGECCIVASEENEEFIRIDSAVSKSAKYIVAIDPLDGSSNIDVNVPVGTIFSIYRRKSLEGPAQLSDVLQKGTEQVAAGYVVYGSSTMLVYTTGCGVNGFTLDPSIGEFCLSHPEMKMPKTGVIYSINEGYYVHFPQGVKKYIKYCQVEDAATNRPYTSRYIGSMVADLHRNLIKGGIFIYPNTAAAPNGKLRLVYECNPLSFVIEQAGGRATNGMTRILDLEVTELHQRSPIFIGSEEMVLQAEKMMAEAGEYSFCKLEAYIYFMKKKLDKFDIGILNALQKDCRISCKKIGAQVGLSETPVQVRIQHMYEDGYIKRFTALLDAKKVGYGLIGYVQAKLVEHTEESLTNFMTEAVKLEEVKECYHMSGAYDFLMRVAISDMEEYSKILMKKLAKLPGKPHFESFFVMAEGKCETSFEVR